MKYRVDYTQDSKKFLKKMNKYDAGLLIKWIEKHLVDCENPRAFGKGLTANRSGQWRYRIGDYRIIADIQDDKVLILIIDINHRSEVYRK